MIFNRLYFYFMNPYKIRKYYTIIYIIINSESYFGIPYLLVNEN
jgi:hypothetical protein